MKRSCLFFAVLTTVGFSTVLVQAQPFGVPRRTFEEPFMGARFPTVSNGLAFPKKLSQTGAFENTTNFTVARSLIPYEVTSPLWSDDAKKTRWLVVPKGTPTNLAPVIGYSGTGWVFNAGTVFVKHFDLVTNETVASNNKVRLETRFLVVAGSGNAQSVYGLTYRWNANQDDADLLEDGGGRNDTNFTITGVSGVRTQKWHFPTRSECLTCHTKVANAGGTPGVLGVNTRQFNRDFQYPNAVTTNQLSELKRLGLFSNAPAANSAAQFQAQEPTMAPLYLPQHLNPTDTSATLTDKVRSYLDVNCTHCHTSQADERPTSFDGYYHVPFAKQKIVNTARIKFGSLADSTILRRTSRRPGMPRIGSEIVHGAWTNLLAYWILNSFNPTNAATSASREVSVVFNYPPEAATAQALSNYSVSLGDDPTLRYTITNATLAARTVTLTLSSNLAASTTYKVAVNGIRDTAALVNTSWPTQTFMFKTAGPAAPAPVNDNKSGALIIPAGGGTDITASCNATEEPGEPNHAGNPGGASLWWQWTAGASGYVTVDTTGSSFDTLLSVYTTNGLGELVPIAEDDNVGGQQTSSLYFYATNGLTYFIAVDGYNADCGEVHFHLQPGVGPPPNDNFDQASILSGTSAVAAGSNLDATEESGEPNHALGQGGKSVWWSWTAPSDLIVSLNTAGSGFDTVLAVYTGNNVTNLTEIVSDDDDPGTNTSSVIFSAFTGTTYHFAVDGYLGTEGPVQLTLTSVPQPTSLPHLSPAPLRFESCTLRDSDIVLGISGPDGMTVGVEATTDFVSWKPIGQVVLTGGRGEISDSMTPGSQRRFYRAVQQ